MHSPRALIAVLAAAVIVSTPAAAHADSPTELVSARAVTPVVDIVDGWAYPELEVHLRDPDGVADQVLAMAVGGATLNPGELVWEHLTLVSGTSTDGFWRGTLRVGAAWAGTYTVNQVQYVGMIANGPTFTVRGDRWVATAIRQTLRVVSGNEPWYPSARITHVDGQPVGGALIDATDGWTAWTPAGTPPGTPADADGLWTSPTRVPVSTGGILDAWGGRGSRGFSLQGIGCDDLTVKLQASSKYPAGAVARGNPVIVTGNVWPAPAILRTGGLLQLQQQTAAGWLTVATVTPRPNGRYTLTWPSPAAGTYTMRVRWPGAGTPAVCQPYSVGTSLAAAAVTVR